MPARRAASKEVEAAKIEDEQPIVGKLSSARRLRTLSFGTKSGNWRPSQGSGKT
jgi:hypothetical protein